MRNRIVEEKIIREREAFIQSIDRRTICDLASSYHDDARCRVFKTTHGSFNICFFVEFDSVSPQGKPDRWVIRIPFPGRVPWIDEKIDSEVATMKYVRQKTTIPVPDVIAYSYVDRSPIGVAFIIIEYVEGTTLHALGFRGGKRWEYQNGRHPSQALNRVHDQLADVYIQLRGLEFPEIGALGMPIDATQDIRICHRPLPIEVLLQHTEGLDPEKYFPEKKTFKTSLEYIMALAKLAFNQLKKTQDPDFGPHAEDAREVLFANYHFCKYVATLWTRKRGNNGPFALMHGDMSLHSDNLIWDEALNLRAVVDWEWSYTVPIQCFIPPAWLNGFHPQPIRFLSSPGRADYQNELISFCESIAKRSETRLPKSPLSREWQHMYSQPRYLIVLALLYPSTINDVYWNFVNFKLHPIHYESPESIIRYREECDKRLNDFFAESRVARDLLQRKLSEHEHFSSEYERYLEKSEGELKYCQCECCQEEKENFENLRELPLLP